MEDAADMVAADLAPDLEGGGDRGRPPDLGGTVVLPGPDDLVSVILEDEEVE